MKAALGVMAVAAGTGAAAVGIAVVVSGLKFFSLKEPTLVDVGDS